MREVEGDAPSVLRETAIDRADPLPWSNVIRTPSNRLELLTPSLPSASTGSAVGYG
jgi:hypothetical protein